MCQAMKNKSDIKRVAVFSDTHGNRKEIYKTISQMGYFDMIIHLGDGVADGNIVAEEFGIQFCGIKGNEDHGMDYPISRALNINRWVFFMLHGNQTEINPYQMKSEYDRHIKDMCDMAKRENADILLLGWGSTFGAITEATEELVEKGEKVACIQLRHINPLPDGLGDILGKYKKVLVIENNTGQLWIKLRAQYLLDLEILSKVRGMPFNVPDIISKVEAMLNELVSGEGQ